MRKYFSLTALMLFTVSLFAIQAEPAASIDMKQFEQSFASIQNAMAPEARMQFEMLCERLLTPGLYMPDYFSDQNLINELMAAFPAGFPNMSQDGALFYLSYRLWQRTMGIDLPLGSTPKGPIGAAKAPTGAVGAPVQSMASNANAQAMINNICAVAAAAHQKIKADVSNRKIRTNIDR